MGKVGEKETSIEGKRIEKSRKPKPATATRAIRVIKEVKEQHNIHAGSNPADTTIYADKTSWKNIWIYLYKLKYCMSCDKHLRNT